MDNIDTDERFGGCPECGGTSGFMNVGQAHWFVCDDHLTKWCAGFNLFSSWKDEAEDDWKRNAERLEKYEEVSPIYPLDDVAELVSDGEDQSSNPLVVIKNDGDAFRVDVVPPSDDLTYDTFGSHRAAFGFAAGLRLTKGWRIEDQTREAAHSAF